MRRPLVLMIFLSIAAIFAGGAWWVGYRTALLQIADRGDADLRSATDRLISQLSLYRLTAVRLADHPDVLELAKGSEQAKNISQLFLQVADETGALEITFFGPDGRRRATSHPGVPLKQDTDDQALARAMTGALGVGHGVTQDKSQRAFTFMAPVFLEKIPVGAVAVRIDMEAVEESDWRGAPQVYFFTDEQNQVFITNRSELLFREFAASSGTGKFAPKNAKNFAGVPVWTTDEGGYLPKKSVYRELPAPVIGMTGRALFSTEPAEQIAFLQAAVVAAMFVTFGAVLFLVSERRRALAQANARLEIRVAERTEALARVNTDLRHEISERLETEGALRQAQADLVQAGKLSALGHMSAGISHELNQPLMAIRSYSENANLFLDKGNADQTRKNLSHISDLSRRMARIIKNLRAFARQEQEPMSRVNIASVVNTVIELSDSRLKAENISPSWVPPQGQIHVLGGEVRLQQVLMNLVTNALDAMIGQTHKSLEISVSETDNMVQLCIRDNGPGLDDPDKIFDPFYTTKTVGQSEEGMGLGLSISYGLVQSFGGAISGRNHPEGGAIFTVELTPFDQRNDA